MGATRLDSPAGLGGSARGWWRLCSFITCTPRQRGYTVLMIGRPNASCTDRRLLGWGLALLALIPLRAAAEENPMMMLTSSAFTPNGTIPAKHTCDGGDLSPPLAWTGTPAETKTFALIVDDP